MPRKAIAVHTLVLIVMMAMFAVVGLWLLYQWILIRDFETKRAACISKRMTYCEEWKANTYQPPAWDWNDREPQGCEVANIGIIQPLSKDDCESMT